MIDSSMCLINWIIIFEPWIPRRPEDGLNMFLELDTFLEQ